MAPVETTIFGIVGWSGSGKTTLMLDLLPDLIKRGYQISTMKHTHHNFDMDKPGKDSFQHREAGAHQVLILALNVGHFYTRIATSRNQT